MDLQLSGKTALVTAATGGIGLAIAKTLAEEGAHLIITGRAQNALDETTAELSRLGGTPAGGLLHDASTAAGANAISRDLPAVDILVNCLGIYESRAFADIDDAGWARMIETNVMSGVRLSRLYLPGMLARGWGRIVFISSEASLTAPPDMIHYAVTKTAQLTLARGLAQLTRGTEVTVNAVMPGPTHSAGIETFLRSQAPQPDAPLPEIEAEYFRRARPDSILQRLLDADEIASLVAYLSSPRSSGTNGAALRVEGGLIDTIA